MAHAPAPEIVVFLDVARIHRQRAEEIRTLGHASADERYQKHLEGLAAKLESQAVRLETHAMRLLSLSDRTDQLAAELQTEISEARKTIAQIKKALVD